MNSILNNSAALSALRALENTQQSLATVQNQVSTGLKVGSAADNSSYWAIAAQLTADSGVVNASNDALSVGQSVLATASSALDSVKTTLNSMATTLTQAQNPGANVADINTSLASLGKQLSDSVNQASFNGLNILDGSQNTLSFVAGFNATSSGGTVNTIAFAAQALTGGSTSTPTTTTTNSSITDSATISALQTLYAGGNSTNTTASFGNNVVSVAASGPASMTVTSMDLYGNTTATTYTALELEREQLDDGHIAHLRHGLVACGVDHDHDVGHDESPHPELYRSHGRQRRDQHLPDRHDDHRRERPHRGQPGAGGGHKLRRADRRHPEPDDGGDELQLGPRDELRERHLRPRRREHEPGFDTPAGAADAGAARHPVPLGRQPERAADPQTLRLRNRVTNSPRAALP